MSSKRKKRKERKIERQEAALRELNQLGSVYACVMRAREIYRLHQDATHPLIDTLEEIVNNSFKFSFAERKREAEKALLYLSPTSNRFFIRLEA